jgi:hypothetical protein
MYGRLAASLGASLVVMYFLAFSQIDQFEHFNWSLSVFWITLSMVSAMALIMLVAMGSMLRNKRLTSACWRRSPRCSWARSSPAATRRWSATTP